jgi:hypothetical protein
MGREKKGGKLNERGGKRIKNVLEQKLTGGRKHIIVFFWWVEFLF